jgi:hypothetical protein
VIADLKTGGFNVLPGVDVGHVKAYVSAVEGLKLVCSCARLRKVGLSFNPEWWKMDVSRFERGMAVVAAMTIVYKSVDSSSEEVIALKVMKSPMK